ncbi:MAG: HEAT repeat domain-containing protein [Spirochaetes bacterium]|nr:HEAT repeat domain-containing protein [Spirochaetota bacterium]
MGYYDLTASERRGLYGRMEKEIARDISSGTAESVRRYASHSDTHIRKNCYLILGRLYGAHEGMRGAILSVVDSLAKSDDRRARQTAVYSLGEIGKRDFHAVAGRLEAFLQETHHAVKNGLTGALKRMGEKNPGPVVPWVREKIRSCSPDMRKRILHGLELRGRTHPEDLLPILGDVSREGMDRGTRRMLVHIVGQISYKDGCIEKVTAELKTWNDKELVAECEKEILKVHRNYRRFSVLTHEEAREHCARSLWGSS